MPKAKTINNTKIRSKSIPAATLAIDAKRVKTRKKAAAAIDSLSPAERAVFNLIVEGKTAFEIGKALDRSTFTISNHTRRVFEAFGLSSRSALIALFAVPIDAEMSLI